jgi:hypothetical protein
VVGCTDDGLAQSLTSLYLRERFDGIRLYDDALPTLDILRERFENDVVGARQAGLAAIWPNRRGEPNDSGVEPDRDIALLTDLLDIF